MRLARGTCYHGRSRRHPLLISSGGRAFVPQRRARAGSIWGGETTRFSTLRRPEGRPCLRGPSAGELLASVQRKKPFTKLERLVGFSASHRGKLVNTVETVTHQESLPGGNAPSFPQRRLREAFCLRGQSSVHFDYLGVSQVSMFRVVPN